jgi:hypothetical protein
MREQDVWRYRTQVVESLSLILLNIFGLEWRRGADGRANAPNAQDGSATLRIILRTQSIWNASLEFVDTLIGVYREDWLGRLVFEVIQPGMILMVAAHEDHREGCARQSAGSRRIIFLGSEIL